ncbi:PPK2 family polyphosphate kinase [Acetobacter sp. DsW_059]|uniref:PPK2 family polyphosphate kinase n=1 Tax=Acetobacter sp. DsW_059 TaxID=1670661 RepID=UPI003513D257
MQTFLLYSHQKYREEKPVSKLTQFLDVLDSYSVTDGSTFNLKNYKPDDDGKLGLKKEDGVFLLKEVKALLQELQELLYANKTHSLLIVLQGMDAAGKDGTIKHVMSGVNPQGVSVASFKNPSSSELAHGFLWRIHAAAPEAGHIGLFNRSHYEDVLVTKVHPELLEKEHLSGPLNTPEFWEGRYDDIRNLEHYLSRQGTVVIKFFLNISRKKQKKRLLERLDIPEKRWKFSSADLREREFWDKYQEAFQDAISATASPHAPWVVVPSDRKWYARLVVIGTIIRTLKNLHQELPKPDPEVNKYIDDYREHLLREKD